MQITEAPTSAFALLAQVSIAFTVDRVLDAEVLGGGLGGIVLHERVLAQPYTKDYDALQGEGPTRWAQRFDVSNWGLLLAHEGATCVGGAVIAYRTPGVHLLEGRDDLAVLWDLRVAPAMRGRGVGAALFAAAEAWTVARGGRQLKVETQNINVQACRFYARQGCALGSLHRFAYPELPGEVQLLWYKALHPPDASPA